MDKELIQTLTKDFESLATEIDGVECWFARDLQKPLGYDKWENFYKVVQKAEIACENAGNLIADHFLDVRKMVSIGSQASREIDDIVLTRYACYLIAQNGDPRKDEIAFAQTYFALQTRKQELLEERLRLAERLRAREKLVSSEVELSKLIYERGVDERGFGRIRSKGDAAMFGGYDTRQMKYRLSVPQNRPLADFLPTITITAKNLATEITNFNVQEQSLHGEPAITDEHVKNNDAIRKTLIERGIKSENLPPEEDIKKLERRLCLREQKIAQTGEEAQNSGEEKLNPYLSRGIFIRLQNPALFQAAAVVAGSVEWPGGLDLSYDTLYLKSRPVEAAASEMAKATS